MLRGARVPSSRPNVVTACRPENKETVDGVASQAHGGRVNHNKQNYISKSSNINIKWFICSKY